MYYVYVLESQLDKDWYIGYSEQIDHRVDEHNAGLNVSTKARRPWILIYYEAYLHKLDALGRERFLKSGAGHRFLRKQMKHFFEGVRSSMR
ncbi:MAG: GIY-YIG nuclease family protein [bacterium]|nr:GIY-YIG nuclease family protein [bacterium]